MKSQSAAFIAKEEGQERFPGELYHIWRTSAITSVTEHWRHTSGDVAVVYDGETYAPMEITRDSPVFDEKLEVNTIKLTVKHLSQPAAEFISVGPADLIWISIHKLHRDMVTEETSPIFIGQLKNTSFQGVSAQISCVGFEHYLKQVVPRYRYGPGCQHTLYDLKCGVTRASYTAAGIISGLSTSGLVVTATIFNNQPTDYYTLGFLLCGSYYRMIASHSGSVINLRYPIQGMKVGDAIEVSSGCDKTRATCNTKFANLVNNLSFPDIPKDNPALWV